MPKKIMKTCDFTRPRQQKGNKAFFTLAAL